MDVADGEEFAFVTAEECGDDSVNGDDEDWQDVDVTKARQTTDINSSSYNDDESWLLLPMPLHSTPSPPYPRQPCKHAPGRTKHPQWLTNSSGEWHVVPFQTQKHIQHEEESKKEENKERNEREEKEDEIVKEEVGCSDLKAMSMIFEGREWPEWDTNVHPLALDSPTLDNKLDIYVKHSKLCGTSKKIDLLGNRERRRQAARWRQY